MAAQLASAMDEMLIGCVASASLSNAVAFQHGVSLLCILWWLEDSSTSSQVYRAVAVDLSNVYGLLVRKVPIIRNSSLCSHVV